MMVVHYTFRNKPEMVGFKLGVLFLLKNLEKVHNSEHNVKK
jgi:hypothetical protein